MFSFTRTSENADSRLAAPRLPAAVPLAAAPTDVKIDKISGTITWKASVDYQSGIWAFIIERDGKKIGQVPEERQNRFGGRPLLQGLSYGDTPEVLLKFQFIDTAANLRESPDYRVVAVNSAGLRSR